MVYNISRLQFLLREYSEKLNFRLKSRNMGDENAIGKRGQYVLK